MRDGGQHHIPAIAATHNRDLRRIKSIVLLHPIDDRADVLHRILAFEAVVQGQKRFSIPAGAAHVRVNDADAKLVQIIIVARLKTGARLALWAAVNVDNDWPLAGKFCGVGPINKCRDWSSIEALELDQLRDRKSTRLNSSHSSPSRMPSS